MRDSKVNSSSDNIGNMSTAPEIIDFEGPEDMTDPLNWSRWYKWFLVILLSAMTLMTNFATVICIPAAPQILEYFGSQQQLYITFLVSVWELGEAFGPLLIAPMSEVYGRYYVYNIVNVLFIICSVACSVSQSLQMLLAFRFLNGFTVAAITVNPGIVGDIFIQEERGTALALLNLPPLAGTIFGPLVGGFLTEAGGWQWCFRLSAIAAAVCELFFLVCFRDTYRVTILRRKAARLAKGTGRKQIRSKYDLQESYSIYSLVKESLFRPIQMLTQCLILVILAMYEAVMYGLLYLVSTTLTELFESIYGFSPGAAGLAYLGLGIGLLVGILLCAFTSDWWLKKMAAQHGEMKPEYRLPPLILGGLVLPIGFFMYGWTARKSVPWIVPVLSNFLLGFGLAIAQVPLSIYTVDAFKLHAASAMAATTILKCVVGALLPLAGPPLYDNLGVAWGNSVLGFASIALLPVPVLFVKCGERLRKVSKFIS